MYCPQSVQTGVPSNHRHFTNNCILDRTHKNIIRSKAYMWRNKLNFFNETNILIRTSANPWRATFRESILKSKIRRATGSGTYHGFQACSFRLACKYLWSLSCSACKYNSFQNQRVQWPYFDNYSHRLLYLKKLDIFYCLTNFCFSIAVPNESRWREVFTLSPVKKDLIWMQL